MHRTVEINDCTAMVHASPKCGADGKAGVQQAEQRGNPTSNSSWILSGISSPSASHRKAQWPSQTALELVLRIVQTHSSGHWTIPHIWQGCGFCHPPGKSAHMMEPSYNQPPEIFWLATVFKADKRGICESTPWGNRILFNSVELLNLPKVISERELTAVATKCYLFWTYGIGMYSTPLFLLLAEPALAPGAGKDARVSTCTAGGVQRGTRSKQTAPEVGRGRMKPTLAHHRLFAVERQGEWPQRCLQRGMEQDFRCSCSEDLPFLWDKEVNHLVSPLPKKCLRNMRK